MTIKTGTIKSSLAPHQLARAIGLGRMIAGGGFLLAPIGSTRVLGLDTATAKRVSFLARMMAVRDVVIGAGTAAAGRGAGRPAGWLLAGAVADATDAVVIAGALRAGRARGPVAASVVGIAAAAAAVGAIGALGSLSRLRRPS